ncbi:hypothetical protein B7494_g1113 [Chlorociboria aeruginascens]|nr:hypothetical protein B7494_g1113 [Chlorociboria aeruginascens]
MGDSEAYRSYLHDNDPEERDGVIRECDKEGRENGPRDESSPQRPHVSKGIVREQFKGKAMVLKLRDTTAAKFYNSTTDCLEPLFGGCCIDADLDYQGYSSTCYNATLVANNVGGSTFGTVDRWLCRNWVTGNATLDSLNRSSAFCYELYVSGEGHGLPDSEEELLPLPTLGETRINTAPPYLINLRHHSLDRSPPYPTNDNCPGPDDLLSRNLRTANIQDGQQQLKRNPRSTLAVREFTSKFEGRFEGASRHDLTFLGIGTSASGDVPERRETKQEREARKLEQARVIRAREREKSIKEEHVDGGYLVTMGVYTGPEDFNKAVVRQLMIERRIAPFWRGLEEFKEEWTEHQLVAAGRGLPIPAADEIPEEEGLASPESPHTSNPNLQNLMVPIIARSLSAASDASTSLLPSRQAFSGTSPTSPATPPPGSHSPSPFRPRSKTLASLTTSSLKNTSSADMVPREIRLPRDPFVNGQAMEVFLYKNSLECPICFMYYPPYLNKTRCCDQPICSECFVQIKRPDPHFPEHDHNDPSHPALPQEDQAEPESLVSEPSTCPYCQQAEFGVLYEPPPFRRGLSYSNTNHGIGAFSSAMSSSTSINSTGNPAPTLQNPAHKRRTTSISATASTVITTDRIRPDWATKLATARNHMARRSAAATALHTAAYVIGSGSGENRGFGFSGRSRFSRHRGESSPASGATSPTSREQGPRLLPEGHSGQQGESRGNRRRSRLDDLEEMMMMEAIRLSIVEQEEQKRKDESRDAKAAAKEAKKKAKEEKKREKKERKVYGSGASSANASALSLSLPMIGRRRGNSGGSNLAREVIPDSAEPSETKGKGVDRSGNMFGGSAPVDVPNKINTSGGFPGARHLESRQIEPYYPPSSPTAPVQPSHLRQMSNASSGASSSVESLHDEPHPQGSSSSLDMPNASETNVENTTSDADDSGNDVGTESMFNFRSLAAMIGDEEDKADAARHVEHLSSGERSKQGSQGEGSSTDLEESIATLKVDFKPIGSSIQSASTSRQATIVESQNTTPEVMVTPETPAALTRSDEDGKQLGSDWPQRPLSEATQ